jgi:hypothetical protein
MTPAGTPPRARSSRWPAGTLAAAGTIPARTMNANATLGFSQGHHPASNRSAIPTRAYESGSGHGHDAAPAGHPTPARSPPGRRRDGRRRTRISAGDTTPRMSAGPGLSTAPGFDKGTLAGALTGQCGQAQEPRPAAASLRAPTPCQIPLPPAPGATPCPQRSGRAMDKPTHPLPNQARSLQDLDGPLHMSALGNVPPFRARRPGSRATPAVVQRQLALAGPRLMASRPCHY